MIAYFFLWHWITHGSDLKLFQSKIHQNILIRKEYIGDFIQNR